MASTAAAPASGNAAASTAMSGFICPNCVVTLPSAEKLQSHWLEFHAEDTPGHQDFTHVPRQTDHVANSRGRDSVSPSSSAVPDGGERNGENGVNGSGQGTNSATSSNTRSTDSPVQDRGRQEAHQLSKSVLSRPRACKVCHQIIWSDTMTCQVCSFHCHLKCVDKDTSLCGRTSAGLVSPVRAATAAKDKAVVSKSAPDSRAPQPHEPRGLVSKVRHKVAQGRARYIDESFDLDLCYITERLIAMSFPSAGVEATYRNNLNDVARMLKLKHKENYMVFNVSERSYDVSKLNHQVLDFGWPDHLAPPLDRLCSICKSIDSWLASDLANVAVVHCKGGKGRTGVVVSAYMHYSNQHDLSAEAALDLFAMKRFYDDRCGGVTQPSQRRLVKYFEWLLKGQIQFTKSPLYLSAILIHGIPNFDGHGYCRPYVRVYQDLKVVYTSDILTVIPGSEADLKKRVVFELATPLVLHGDVMIRCFHKRTTGHEVIFRLQFHTCAAVRDQRMVLAKAELDDAHSDRRFPDSARVELIFQPPPVEIDDPTIATALGSKISSDAGAFQGSPLFPSKTSSKQEPSPVVSPLQKSSVRGRTRIPPKISEDSLITVEQDDDTVLVERVDDVQSSIQGSLGKVDDELADVEIGRVGSFGVTSGVQRPPKREIPVKVSENSALGTVNQGYESIALVGNQGARPAHSTQVTHQQSTMSASSAGGSDLISLEDTISNAERQLHFPPVDAVKSASCYLLEHVDQVPELPSRRKSPRGSHDGDLNVEQSASMRTFPHSMATSVDDSFALDSMDPDRFSVLSMPDTDPQAAPVSQRRAPKLSFSRIAGVESTLDTSKESAESDYCSSPIGGARAERAHSVGEVSPYSSAHELFTDGYVAKPSCVKRPASSPNLQSPGALFNFVLGECQRVLAPKETPAVPSRRPNPSKNAKAPLGRVPRHAALMQMGSDPTSAMSQIDRRMQPQDLEPSGVRPSSSDVTHNYADVGAILAAKKQAQRTSPSPSPTASTDTVDEDDVTPILPERPSRFELEETASNSQLAGGDCSRTPKAEGPYSSVSVPTSSPTASDRQANMSPRAAFRELPPLPRQKVAVSNHGSHGDGGGAGPSSTQHMFGGGGGGDALSPQLCTTTTTQARARSSSCSDDYIRMIAGGLGRKSSTEESPYISSAGLLLDTKLSENNLGITPSLSLDSIVSPVQHKFEASKSKTGSLELMLDRDSEDEALVDHHLRPDRAEHAHLQSNHKGLLAGGFSAKMRKRRTSPTVAGSIEMAAQQLKKLTAMRGSYRISLGDMISKKSQEKSAAGSGSGSTATTASSTTSSSPTSNSTAAATNAANTTVAAAAGGDKADRHERHQPQQHRRLQQDASPSPPACSQTTPEHTSTLSRVTIAGEMKLEGTVSTSAGISSNSPTRDRFFQDRWQGNESPLTASAASTRPYWFRKTLSREEADSLLEDRPIGTFLVRESRSAKDAYSLSMRAAPEGHVLIKHYLLEPSGEAGKDGKPGVHLRLTAEGAYESLEQFVEAHIGNALALPCKLILPCSDWVEELRRKSRGGAAASGASVPIWRAKSPSGGIEAKTRSTSVQGRPGTRGSTGSTSRSVRSPVGGGMKLFGRGESKATEDDLEYVRLDFTNVESSAGPSKRRTDTIMAQVQHRPVMASKSTSAGSPGSSAYNSVTSAPSSVTSTGSSALPFTPTSAALSSPPRNHAPASRISKPQSPMSGQPARSHAPGATPAPADANADPDIHTFTMVYLGSSSVTAKNWRSALASSYEQVTARRHLKSIHITMATCPSFIALTDDFGKTLSFDMGNVLHCALDPLGRRFWVSTAPSASMNSSVSSTSSGSSGSSASTGNSAAPGLPAHPINPAQRAVTSQTSSGSSGSSSSSSSGSSGGSNGAIPPGGGRVQERSVMGVIVRKGSNDHKKVCHLFAPRDDNYQAIVVVETIQAQMAMYESLKPIPST